MHCSWTHFWSQSHLLSYVQKSNQWVRHHRVSNFLEIFEVLYVNIKKENPYLILFSGDFNGHCQNWWPDGHSNNDGIAIYDLISNLGLSQLISEPTNLQGNSAPSCIDLTLSFLTNLILLLIVVLSHLLTLFVNINLFIVKSITSPNSSIC